MRPFPILFFLFLAVPIAEMYVLIAVGGEIGALPTIGLVVLTAIIGAGLMRSQGLSTMSKIQTSMAQGQIPAMELAEGAAILLAGALLLTPGFITDTLGFLCLTPPIRRGFIRRAIAQRLHVGQAGFGGFASRGSRSGRFGEPHVTGTHADPRPKPPSEPGRVLEGEFRNDDD